MSVRCLYHSPSTIGIRVGLQEMDMPSAVWLIWPVHLHHLMLRRLLPEDRDRANNDSGYTYCKDRNGGGH
jgi:hypothetical protein